MPENTRKTLYSLVKLLPVLIFTCTGPQCASTSSVKNQSPSDSYRRIASESYRSEDSTGVWKKEGGGKPDE